LLVLRHVGEKRPTIIRGSKAARCHRVIDLAGASRKASGNNKYHIRDERGELCIPVVVGVGQLRR